MSETIFEEPLSVHELALEFVAIDEVKCTEAVEDRVLKFTLVKFETCLREQASLPREVTLVPRAAVNFLTVGVEGGA